ncbi:MAG: MFS transporter [Candidatus Nanopelagicaceae bacterium]|nr:MFS transporter [Candidatus Nanopelagicaceae bacterium]
MKTEQRRILGALFFLFGFGIMAWVPRFPEVKHNLHVGNGQFGTLLSMGAVGSLISLIVVGPLVHRLGTRKVMSVSATFLFGGISLIVHITSVWQFLFCNMVVGAAASAFHIAVNSQGLHEQAPVGENLIPRLHGLWSLGALTTGVLSGLLIKTVPLAVHIDIVSAFVYATMLILIWKLGTNSLKGTVETVGEYSIRSLFTWSNIDWAMGFGITCSVMLEFAIGDWAAIFSKEELHMSAGVSALPYVLFVLAVIFGRLTVHRVTKFIGIAQLIRLCTIIGGTTFVIFVTLGVQISKTSPVAGFSMVAAGSFIGGLGASFLAPTFMHAANRRSKAPGSLVVGQLGAVSTVFVLLIKPVIAWTAQVTSIAVALVIPSLMLIAVSFLATAVKNADA